MGLLIFLELGVLVVVTCVALMLLDTVLHLSVILGLPKWISVSQIAWGIILIFSGLLFVVSIYGIYLVICFVRAKGVTPDETK